MSVADYVPRRSNLNRATALTFTRLYGIIPLAPWMFLLGIYLSPFWGGVVVSVFMALAFTDLLDGWLARRSELADTYGRQLDRGVDKRFAFYSLFWLVLRLFMSADWAPACLFLAICLFRLFQDGQGTRFNNLNPKAPSNMYGKVKTWADDCTIATSYFLLVHIHGRGASRVALIASFILAVSAVLAQISLGKKRQLT